MHELRGCDFCALDEACRRTAKRESGAGRVGYYAGMRGCRQSRRCPNRRRHRTEGTACLSRTTGGFYQFNAGRSNCWATDGNRRSEWNHRKEGTKPWNRHAFEPNGCCPPSCTRRCALRALVHQFQGSILTSLPPMTKVERPSVMDDLRIPPVAARHQGFVAVAEKQHSGRRAGKRRLLKEIGSSGRTRTYNPSVNRSEE